MHYLNATEPTLEAGVLGERGVHRRLRRGGSPDACGRRSYRGGRGRACQRHNDLQSVEEADEFLMPMSGHIPADHRDIEDIRRREQCGRAVPDVIVGHRPGPTLLHRRTWLGAVEAGPGLNRGQNLRLRV